jgi:transcriptional regulator
MVNCNNCSMYVPPQFATTDSSQACALIRAYPFASLISVDDEGLPFVTPLPLHLLEEEGRWLLLGHCAKPNPHWRYLQERPKAVVTFMGPQAYMSPSVYPNLARVPTWNYLMVHCTVQARLIEQFDDKDRLLKHLIHEHDPAYEPQWRGLGDDFQHKMMAGMVAFELEVIELQCKLKLNQHRPESHQALYNVYAGGNADQRALADWMVRLGMVGVIRVET